MAVGFSDAFKKKLLERYLPVSYESEVQKLNRLLTGAKVLGIQMDPDNLVFHLATDAGIKYLPCTVFGDCCSHSYFWDFIGVDKLVANGPITQVHEVSMDDPDDDNAKAGDVVVAYGYKFISEHEFWGEQTAVMSFRSDSNGYYGGSLEVGELADESPIKFPPPIAHDILGTS